MNYFCDGRNSERLAGEAWDLMTYEIISLVFKFLGKYFLKLGCDQSFVNLLIQLWIACLWLDWKTISSKCTQIGSEHFEPLNQKKKKYKKYSCDVDKN